MIHAGAFSSIFTPLSFPADAITPAYWNKNGCQRWALIDAERIPKQGQIPRIMLATAIRRDIWYIY
jgi:hypothetical protein